MVSYRGMDKPPLKVPARALCRMMWLFFFTALVLEAGIRATGLDMRVLKPLLYYQHAILPIHELSPDADLIYRLKPGSRSVFADADYSVNSLGFRDPPRAARKAPGVFRIVCLGASYMFGGLVNDDESLPRQLEAALNKGFQGRFEVWNAGVSAYDILQEAAYARRIEAEFAPDLILFHLNGAGRRAFLSGAPYAHFFRADPRLYLENLAHVPFARSPLGLKLLAVSALYRTAVIYANYLHAQEQPRPEFTEELNLQAWRGYLAASRPELPKAILLLSAGRGPDPAGTLPEIPLYRGPYVPARLPAAYFLIHPPARVYRLQAQIVAQRLSELFPGVLRKKAPGARIIEPLRGPSETELLRPVQIQESLRAMREAGRYDCLIPLLESLSRQEPGDESYRQLLAQETATLGRTGAAPASEPRAGALASARLAREPKPALAAAPASSAPARAPQVDAQMDLAARYWDQRRDDQALEILGRIRTPSARHRMALVYQRLGRYPEAIAVLEGLVREHPQEAAYLKDLGICEYLSGRTGAAIRDLERSLRLAPRMLAATQSLGTILEQRANPAEALRLYRRALRTAGGEPRLRAQIQESAAALERPRPVRR